jgi:hypothetical protein
VRRVNRPDTWQHRLASQHAHTTLANGEPSTQGYSLPFRACPQYDRNTTQSRHSGFVQTAVGHIADLPSSGIAARDPTQTSTLRRPDPLWRPTRLPRPTCRLPAGRDSGVPRCSVRPCAGSIICGHRHHRSRQTGPRGLAWCTGMGQSCTQTRASGGAPRPSSLVTERWGGSFSYVTV